MMLFQLFLFFLCLLALPDLYIYRRYLRDQAPRWVRWFHWVPSGLLLVFMTILFLLHEPQPASMQRLGLFLLVFLAITVPKALFALTLLTVRGLDRLTSRWCHRPQNRRWQGTYLASAVAIASFGTVIYGATEGIQHYQVREVDIVSADLPPGFDGYRIVQLSDIHAGSWAGNPEAVQRAVDRINEQHPDLIVFTGDLVNNLATEVDEFLPILKQLHARDGIYSVLGNHDYSPYIAWESPAAQQANLDSLQAKQAAMGWKLLNNDHVLLYHDGDSIALCGVENSGRPPFPDHGDLPRALQGTEGLFRILLSHDPTHWRREVLPQSDVQLTLSGHTHDMQINILGFTPSRFVYPEHNGLYREGEQQLFVNIGLGHLMFPLRLGAWPEITLLTLKTKK